ncbi:MAG: hypothetical protein M4579_000900 [Chaenotheca gracillima]|nr:MAG: hypothetical protein M4579_000900 [Chaenotheca gracillima]
MGQESSKVVDDSIEPQTLEKRNLNSVAKLIKSGKAKRIVLMVGAGISTSAGIPDFRSPETGLYANLARLNLEQPEDVFNISFFRENPLPFYTLAQELYPGKYRPTITHSFLRMLSDKGLLMKLFTQNIDCLEREAGVPGEKIVEAHGSFARHSCIDCRKAYPEDKMKAAIDKKEVPHCLDKACDGLVKPEIVFFGEQLPQDFFLNRELPSVADLCIVMGTSLSVQPFASLPAFCGEGVPRLLINLERVGGLGSRSDDVLLLEDCDKGIRKLATALGWLDELEALWEETNPNKGKAEEQGPPKDKNEKLEDEIEKLTGEVDQSLKIADEHGVRVRDQIGVKKEIAPSEAKTEEEASKLHYASDNKETVHKATAGNEAGDKKNGQEDSQDLKHVFPHLKL